MHLQDSLFQFFLCCMEGFSIYAFTGHFINITVDSLFQFDLLFLLLGSINESTDI